MSALRFFHLALRVRSRTDVIGAQSAVTFRHWHLTDVIANEILSRLRGSKRGKLFAAVHLTERCDRFETRRPINVCSAEGTRIRNRIVKLVGRSSMERDPKS